jgi:hypothetical protein
MTIESGLKVKKSYKNAYFLLRFEDFILNTLNVIELEINDITNYAIPMESKLYTDLLEDE